MAEELLSGSSRALPLLVCLRVLLGDAERGLAVLARLELLCKEGEKEAEHLGPALEGLLLLVLRIRLSVCGAAFSRTEASCINNCLTASMFSCTAIPVLRVRFSFCGAVSFRAAASCINNCLTASIFSCTAKSESYSVDLDTTALQKCSPKLCWDFVNASSAAFSLSLVFSLFSSAFSVALESLVVACDVLGWKAITDFFSGAASLSLDFDFSVLARLPILVFEFRL